MRKIIACILLFLSITSCAQTGYDQKPVKTWFKDTTLHTKPLIINTQGGAIIGGYNKNADAILELSSTTRGFAKPRMTTAQRLAMTVITNGLEVYDTDLNLPCTYTGSWVCQVAGATGPTGGQGVAGATGATGSNGATGATGASYSATSTTSLTVGTGSKTLTTQSGLAYVIGSRVRVTHTAFADYMEGVVTGYNSGTGELIFTSDNTNGSGTHAAWTLSIAGDKGADGATGDTGSAVGWYVRNDTLATDSPIVRLETLALPGAGSFVLANDEGVLYPVPDADIAGLFWGLEGNAGIDTTINFIGTTDPVDLVFKINSEFAGMLTAGNTFFGHNALLSQGSIGDENTGFGVSALQNLGNGIQNTAIGFWAGSANATGSNNAYLGHGTGTAITTGNNNTMIGYDAETDDAGALNRIALGAGAIATEDFQFAIDPLVTHLNWLLNPHSEWDVLTDSAGVGVWQPQNPSFDSVTIYALSPTEGKQFYCTDCSGNGITGRIVAFIGSTWRRLLFED